MAKSLNPNSIQSLNPSLSASALASHSVTRRLAPPHTHRDTDAASQPVSPSQPIPKSLALSPSLSLRHSLRLTLTETQTQRRRLAASQPVEVTGALLICLLITVDIPLKYLGFFLEDDAELEHIRTVLIFKEYGSGRMLTGEVKKRLIEVLTELVERHRRARAAVTDEMVEAFMAVRPLPNMFS